MKSTAFLLDMDFVGEEIMNPSQISNEGTCGPYLTTDINDVGFVGRIAEFDSIQTSRFFKALCDVYRRIRHMSTSILVSCDRYKVHLASYKI